MVKHLLLLTANRLNKIRPSKSILFNNSSYLKNMNVALFLRVLSYVTSKDLAATYSDADYKLTIIKTCNGSQ
jgi:hypothetical protein